MNNVWMSLAGLLIAIAGVGILTGVRGFVSTKRKLSAKRQRLMGAGFILLGGAFVIQGVTSTATGWLMLSVLLAALALAAFIWSIVIARQERQDAVNTP